MSFNMLSQSLLMNNTPKQKDYFEMLSVCCDVSETYVMDAGKVEFF